MLDRVVASRERTMKRIRKSAIGSIAFVLALATWSTSTATVAIAEQANREWQNCVNADNDSRIAACTAILDKGGRESNKQRVNAYNERGLAYGNKGQHDKALQDFDEALRLDPQNAMIHNNRGWAFNNKGDPDHAIRDLDEAIRLNPKFAVAFNNRGYSYLNKSDYDRAIHDFDDAIRFNPKYANAFNNRGRSFTAKGQYDRALKDLDEAIRLDPKVSSAYNNRGWTFNKKQEFDRALIDLDEAVRIDPKNAIAYINRSASYNGKHDYDRAIREAGVAIDLTPSAVNAYFNRGQAYTAKAMYDFALRDLDEAIRLAPRNVAVLNGRGFAYKQKGDFDRAIRDLDEAIRIDPNFFPLYSNRGDAYRQKGDPDRAIVDLSAAIRLEPKITPAYTFRGLAYEALGDKDRAVDDFNTALSLPRTIYVTSDWAVAKARERLALLGAAVTAAAGPPPLGAVTPTAAPPLGRRVALVIGNSDYHYAGKLANPTNDESDFATMLRQLGFEVVAGSNLDHHGMDNAIREFGRKLEGADLALFFYAGHGLQVGGKNYLVPVDAKLERVGDLTLDAVDINTVLAQMEGAKRVNLVFLDACRDNPLARSLVTTFGTRGIAIGPGLASVQSAIGTMIAYSTQPDNVAFDGAGRNSPFTAALLRHIATPNVEIGTIMRKVRADVVAATHERQVPWDSSSLIGEVILAR
jgi:tetratricopeptide (TPR) repeat protein